MPATPLLLTDYFSPFQAQLKYYSFRKTCFRLTSLPPSVNYCSLAAFFTYHNLNEHIYLFICLFTLQNSTLRQTPWGQKLGLSHNPKPNASHSDIWKGLKNIKGNSLAVQWLGLCAFTAEGTGSIPGWGTKIPQATWGSQKNIYIYIYLYIYIYIFVYI